VTDRGQTGVSENRACVVVAILALFISGSGCLVLSVHPAYDSDSIAWEPNLVGKWHNADDNASMDIQRGEWRSYKVLYEHPIEKGELTGYLTSIGDERYLDVMPVRGEDRGSFLVPVHVVLRVRLEEDKLELTPISYDWFSDRLRPGHDVPGLAVALDQKENALITSPTAKLRTWLRAQRAEGPTFGAPATFVRK
jgi:hypothetical protein